jgi:hypothetical protein
LPTHFPHNADRGSPVSISQQRSLIQVVAAACGAVMLLAGVVSALRSGIVHPGYYMSMTNCAFHVIGGACGCLLAGSVRGARGFLVVGGPVYLVLTLVGATATHTAVQASVAGVMIITGVWPGTVRS